MGGWGGSVGVMSQLRPVVAQSRGPKWTAGALARHPTLRDFVL